MTWGVKQFKLSKLENLNRNKINFCGEGRPAPTTRLLVTIDNVSHIHLFTHKNPREREKEEKKREMMDEKSN